MLAELRRLKADAKRLRAALKGVAGFTGSGFVRFFEKPNWGRRIDADLSGLGGLKADIIVNGAWLGALECRAGAAAGRFDGARGASIPSLCEGDIVEIRQNGVAVLRGALERA